MSKMPSLIGPELQCLSSPLLIPFRVLGPTLLSPGDFEHYFLKKISAEHRALTTFTGGFLDPWNMQDLLQSNRHLNLTYILVYTP